MQLKLHKKHSVEVTDGTNKAIFSFSPEDGVKISDETPVIVGPLKKKGIFYGPGEYEVSNIAIYALETKEDPIGVADLYKLVIEDVHILFVVDTPDKILKQDWDLIGEVDILVINSHVDDPEFQKFLKKVEPFVIIAVGAIDKEEAEKLVGQQVESTEKRLKFSHKDFKDEEMVNQLYILA